VAITISTTGRWCKASFERVTWRAQRTPSSMGLVVGRLLFPNAERRWSIALPLSSKAEKDALIAEYVAAKGSAGEITFTPPRHAVAITARFADDSQPWIRRSASPYGYDLVFEVVEDSVPFIEDETPVPEEPEADNELLMLLAEG
jgi:hypothetical protein